MVGVLAPRTMTTMVTLKVVISVALLTVFTGCDSVSYRQYLIRDASSADEKSVAAILATAANKAGFRECTNESRIPKTLVGYVQSVEHFPVSLGARVTEQGIVVDLSCFHPSPFAPTVFKTVDSVLSTVLPNKFSERLLPFPKCGFLHYQRKCSTTTCRFNCESAIVA